MVNSRLDWVWWVGLALGVGCSGVGCSGDGASSGPPEDPESKGEGLPAGSDCSANGDCASSACNDSECAPGTDLAAGKTCLEDGECKSGDCARGMCASSSGSGGAGGAAGNGTGGSQLNVGGQGPDGTPDACAAATTTAELTPLNLVIMYDKSGSMGNPAIGTDPETRWIPVGLGMVNFFQDPASASLKASLDFFPANGGLEVACTEENYELPTVPLTPLTESDVFIQAIQDTTPSGGTPTFQAMKGALDYASKVALETGDATVIVLVTDGLPRFWQPCAGQNSECAGTFSPDKCTALGCSWDAQAYADGCPNNNIEGVQLLAADALSGVPSIPTYVIGIGEETQKLDRIAQAGGTSEAILVLNEQDPKVTSSTIQTAFNSIRKRYFSCKMDLPEPPEGDELDFLEVNLKFSPSEGDPVTYEYRAGCEGGEGWHYLDAEGKDVGTERKDFENAAKIEICEKTCDSVQVDTSGALSVELGCATQGIPIR